MLFFFQAEDGIRDLVRSRGLGDVYKRQARTGNLIPQLGAGTTTDKSSALLCQNGTCLPAVTEICLLYTSDAADERSSVDLGGRRIIKKKKKKKK